MLFGGYETVAKADVSALPFEVLGSRNEDPRVYLIAPFDFLFAAFDAVAPRTAERVMSETAVVLGGMKDFRAPTGPTGLGGVSSRNCYVLIVKRGFDLARVLDKPPTERWEGMPVWRWSAQLSEFGDGNDRPSTIIALQMPPYVLVSNDPDNVFANARSLQTGSNDELQKLTEWRDVGSHQYWMFRRLRFDVPDLNATGLDRVRRDLKSFVLFHDRGHPAATLRVVARNPTTEAAEPLNHSGLLPALKPITPTTWEGQLPLTVGSGQSDAWFVAMFFFGLGVYV